MDKIRFAHLSDPHVRIDHSKSNLNCVFQKVRNPNDSLKEALNEIKQMNLNFVVISGDLVHEGGTEDYECLHRILTESALSIPVFLALGNHDRKDEFGKVFLNSNRVDRYYYLREVNGLQVIVLDSAEPGCGRGIIDETQLSWLENILSKPCDKGSIMVVHHPLFWADPLLSIENPDRLVKIIKASNVRGIFCGHIHKGRMGLYNGIFQSIAESAAFGFDYDEQTTIASDRRGFNLCTVSAKEVSVCHEIFQAKSKPIAEIPMGTLRTLLG